MFDNFDVQSLIDGGVKLLTGLLILLIAYIVAVIARRIVRSLLKRTDLDNRIAKSIGGQDSFPIEGAIGTLVFWLIMFFGIIAAFDQWDLEAVTGPLNNLLDSILGFLPSLGGGIILGLVAYVVASIVKILIERGADAAKLDKRIQQLDSDAEVSPSIGSSLATAGFWFVILLFLPSIISRLGMESLVEPINNMLNDFMGFLPNLFSAAIIAVVGWFIARIIRQVITSLLNVADVDRFGRNAGLDLSISNLIGTLVYTIILLLTITQALAALQLDSISGPATNMIDQLFESIPKIFGAGLILVISYILGKLISGLVTSLLQSAGFDSFPSKMGIELKSERSLSEWAGWAVLVGIMVLAITPATTLLGFESLTVLVSLFIAFAGQILVGIIVLGIGFFIANFAANFMKSAGFSPMAVNVVRAAILVLIGAMALTRMGIGEQIVELAFGIGLGAVGIAAALAFGLGSRDIAGREVENFVAKTRANEISSGSKGD